MNDLIPKLSFELMGLSYVKTSYLSSELISTSEGVLISNGPRSPESEQPVASHKGINSGQFTKGFLLGMISMSLQPQPLKRTPSLSWGML